MTLPALARSAFMWDIQRVRESVLSTPWTAQHLLYGTGPCVVPGTKTHATFPMLTVCGFLLVIAVAVYVRS